MRRRMRVRRAGQCPDRDRGGHPVRRDEPADPPGHHRRPRYLALAVPAGATLTRVTLRDASGHVFATVTAIPPAA